MEGKRFGAGLVGGLLLGALVVYSASFGPTAPAFSALNQQVADKGSQSYTTTSETSTTYSNGTSGSVPVSSGTTTTTTASQANPGGTFGPVSGAVPALASRVDNIPKQSPLTDALVLLPLLLAVTIGAVLYRASKSNDEPEETEAK
ncbi:MAG: hypothetical protein HY247_07925 [archaeon]|nr:MAG: hypothetical protein HY247_07925 [archaeon]